MRGRIYSGVTSRKADMMMWKDENEMSDGDYGKGRWANQAGFARSATPVRSKMSIQYVLHFYSNMIFEGNWPSGY